MRGISRRSRTNDREGKGEASGQVNRAAGRNWLKAALTAVSDEQSGVFYLGACSSVSERSDERPARPGIQVVWNGS